MQNPALVSDIEDRWRPLTGQDAVTAASWLDDAWAMLQVDSPGIIERLASGATSIELAVATLAEAVARKGKNADGKRQQSITVDDATRSWTLDASVAAGELFFTDAELRRLGGLGRRRGKAFSLMPS